MTIFLEQTGTDNPLDGVDVGNFSTPTFADLDGDGDLDAFIGSYGSGTISYYENDGSGNFSQVTGTDNPLDGIDVGIFSSPTFADITDIDGDGDLDLFIGAGDGTIKYYDNDGSGNFTELTGSNNPLDIVNVGSFASPTFADIDGDGDLDAFIGKFDGTVKYYENDGSGNFSQITGNGNFFFGVDVGEGAKPSFADIDGDGDLDAFIGAEDGTVKYFENKLPIFREKSGTDNPLANVNGGAFSSVAFADIDGDGDLDAFTGELNGTIDYYENDGSGNFIEVTGSGNPLDSVNTGTLVNPTFADIDGDGDLDAFIGRDNGTIDYYENDGSGNFNQVTGTGNPVEGIDVGDFSSPTFADIADIDGDGDLDLFVGNYYGTINYYENDGSGNFSELTGTGNPLNGIDVGDGSNPSFADIDGDGDLDAFIGNYDGQIKYYENDGSGNFSELVGGSNPLAQVDVGQAATPTFADIDGDGDLDAFIGANDGSINYYENDPFAPLNPNSSPVAEDDVFEILQDTPTTILASDLLFNDTDADGDTLAVTEVSNAANGTVSLDTNGDVLFTPDTGFSGTASFNYTVSDGIDTDIGFVNVDIDTPEAKPAPTSDYTIFSNSEFTVNLAASFPIFSTGDTSVDAFLDTAISSFGGVVHKNGTISDNTLEHFGGGNNPSIRLNNTGDRLMVGGSGVGGSQQYNFDNPEDASVALAFVQDLLGADPALTNIFQFNGGTNGGANTIRIKANDEIIGLNPGVNTTDSYSYEWSGADTSGTQKRSGQDAFLDDMGLLWGGTLIQNAELHVLGTVEVEVTGVDSNQVQIGGSGIAGEEIWVFSTATHAANFADFVNDVNEVFV